LFSDLVGSTEGLLAGLGETAFDEFRRAHFEALRAAVAEHADEEIKTIGEGILAVFGSAMGALCGAVRMQQTIHRPAGGGQPAANGLPRGARLGSHQLRTPWSGLCAVGEVFRCGSAVVVVRCDRNMVGLVGVWGVAGVGKGGCRSEVAAGQLGGGEGFLAEHAEVAGGGGGLAGVLG
jgi:hypothetical protein